MVTKLLINILKHFKIHVYCGLITPRHRTNDHTNKWQESQMRYWPDSPFPSMKERGILWTPFSSISQPPVFREKVPYVKQHDCNMFTVQTSSASSTHRRYTSTLLRKNVKLFQLYYTLYWPIHLTVRDLCQKSCDNLKARQRTFNHIFWATDENMFT